MTDTNEITPQSNYVWVVFNGQCSWRPRFDHSVTHCHIDVTWFPFDEQTCHLDFESWMLPESMLKLHKWSSQVDRSLLLDPEGWHLKGKGRRYEIILPITAVDNACSAKVVSGG